MSPKREEGGIGKRKVKSEKIRKRKGKIGGKIRTKAGRGIDFMMFDLNGIE